MAILISSTLLSGVTFAAPIDITYVGTWASTGSGNSTGVGGPGISPGQRFVIRVTYDDLSAVTNGVDVLDAFFNPSGDLMSTIDLNAAGNSVDIFVPMEGLDGATPFIYTQDETTHFPVFIPNPTLNFVNGSNISDPNNIIGLEFEGDFAGANFNIIELFNTSPGGGNINMQSQVFNCVNSICGSIAASGTNSLATAVGLVFDAGADVVFSAAGLNQTTASTLVQLNDLGAGRSDGEDFVDANWSQTGTASGNDITVSIANSGLANTIDTTTWTVTAQEQMTLLAYSDTVQVNYNNAGPIAEAGSAIIFSAANLAVSSSGATVSDADLAVNAVVAGFESLSFTTDADGNPLVGSMVTGSAVANNVDQVISIADSGLTMTTSSSTLTVSATDFAGASSSDTAPISYLNANPSASAIAIATAGGTDFSLSIGDADLIVNGIIAGFETVSVSAMVDGFIDATAFFSILVGTGTQSETNATLESAFGSGLHTVTFTAIDKAGAVSISSVAFEVVGTELVLVPDVVSLSQSAAEAAISAVDLTVGTVSTSNSATVPAGDVISQSPVAGTSVASGTAVNIVVSLGPSDNDGPITTLTSVVPNLVAVGSNVTLTAFVDDTERGGSNIASAEYSLDGGITWLTMNAGDGVFDEVSENVIVSFVGPTDPAVYDICVRGTDVLGKVGDPECIMLVVYDPEGGFVTGGGWIYSTGGAYITDITLAGKANFGFVSKYKKGAKVPVGNTEFQFKAGNLNFHSSSYEYLVITMGDTNAQFKGSGTINGMLAPNGTAYKFIVWARDSAPDTFRIKIWYEDTGEVLVYDNGFDQAIGGGSIVIHTKKK